jgi:hypothetical protein
MAKKIAVPQEDGTTLVRRKKRYMTGKQALIAGLILAVIFTIATPHLFYVWFGGAFLAAGYHASKTARAIEEGKMTDAEKP